MWLRYCIIVALLFPLLVGCDESASDGDNVVANKRKRRNKSGPQAAPLSTEEREKSQPKRRRRKTKPVNKSADPKKSIEQSQLTPEQKKPDKVEKPNQVAAPTPDPQPSTVVRPLPSGGPDPTEEFLAEVTSAVTELRMDDATNFLCAVCLGHAQQDTVQQYLRWSPALKRPVMGITWGLGVKVKYAKGNDKGIPDVRWRLRGDVRAISGQKRPVPLTDAWRHFTGELGAEIYAELITRINNGDFGQVYTVASKASPGREFPETNAGYPGLIWLGQAGASSGNNSRVDLVLTISLSAASKGTESGDWFTDISAKPSLRDMRGGRALKSWKTFMTGDISRASKKRGDGGGNPFKDYIADIAKYIDENLAVTDFPAREPKAILDRAQALGKKPKHRDSLIELAELQYYFSKGQINKKQKEYVFRKILGEDHGRKLADGTQEEKIAVLKQLLPRVRSAK